MEVNNQPTQGPRPNRRSPNEPIDITRLNREAIQRSTDEFEHSQYSSDSIELSKEGKALAAAGDAKVADAKANEAKVDHDRQVKVQDLRRQYVEGKLNTPARVEKAAHKMLVTD
jgi:hypothetical protein